MAKDKKKTDMKVLSRIVKYILQGYKFSIVAVLLSILISAIATLSGTLFMQTLIDDYIVPLTIAMNPDYSDLSSAISSLSVILLIGVFASWVYNRVMVNVSQGTMNRIRKDLFNHMESLPIRYFDTHAHGDIMSVYTNDVDTFRQVIGQSLPQLMNSTISLTVTFISMIVLNIPLTLTSLVMVAIMLFVTRKISSASSIYYKKQQG